MYNEKEDWNHLLGYAGTEIWGDDILDKGFKNTDAEIGIRGKVGCKNKEQCRKQVYI
jgi:hypothetical protein